jgi:amino acid transporter
MGVEVTSERAMMRYLVWGPIVVMLAYLLTTFGVMVAVPVAHQTDYTSLIEAVQNGFGPAGLVLAVMVNLVMIGFFLFGAVVYNYSFGRLLFVSGLDRRLPAVMGKVNAARVPWVAMLVQCLIVAVIAIILYIVAPYVIPGVDPVSMSTVMYYVILAALTLIWCASQIFQFIDVFVIRFKYSEEFARLRLAPDGILYIASIVGLLANAVAIYATVTAPWVPTLIDVFHWNAWIAGIVAISLVAGVVIYFIGQASMKGDVTDEQIIAESTGKAIGVGGE